MLNSWPNGKPPRWYAHRIIRLHPEQRDDALNRVPGFIRGWVTFYVNDYCLKQKYLAEYRHGKRCNQDHSDRGK